MAFRAIYQPHLYNGADTPHPGPVRGHEPLAYYSHW